MVAIEDLEALLELLREHETITDEVVVQCDEGAFTEAEDVRKLSDQTLADLRIEVNGLVVHLSRDRAIAVGPPELVEYVEHTWARSRQTNVRPAGRTAGFPLYLWAVNVLLTLAVIVMTVATLRSGQETDPTGLPWWAGPVLVYPLLGFLWWTSIARQRRAVGRATWATVRPLSRQELRDQAAQKTVVPLWALVVSVLAFLALLTFNLLNYFWPRSGG